VPGLDEGDTYQEGKMPGTGWSGAGAAAGKSEYWLWEQVSGWGQK
jgi:hypothetical protein